MAQKRMFSRSVIDTDRFQDMPLSAQALYFHFGMHADDDGFVSSPKRIIRAVGCRDDDLRILISKNFVIPFENGVVVITDWNINNTVRKDRYQETIYRAEKAQLYQQKNGSYALGNQMTTKRQPSDNQSGAQYRLVEGSIVENSTDEYSFFTEADSAKKSSSTPTVDEIREYCKEKQYSFDPVGFENYYRARGWMMGNTPIRDWKAVADFWNQNRGGTTYGNQKQKVPYGSDELGEGELAAIRKLMKED